MSDLACSTLGPATNYKVVIVPVCACEWDQMFVYGQHVAYPDPPSSQHHSALLTLPSLAWWNLKRIYFDANPIRLDTTVRTLWDQVTVGGKIMFGTIMTCLLTWDKMGLNWFEKLSEVFWMT